MLTYFSVKNYRSFDKEIALDFSKARDYQFNTDCLADGYIGKAIIYGRNGSGKTNFINALLDIRYTLLVDIYPVQAYLNANSDCSYAEFTYRFLFNEKNVEYFYRKSSVSQLVYEKLSIDENVVYCFDHEQGRFSALDLSLIELETLDESKYVNENEDIETVGSRPSFLKWVYSNSSLKSDAIIFQIVNFALGIRAFNMLIVQRQAGFNRFIQTLKEEVALKKLQNFFTDMGIDANLVVSQSAEGEYRLYYQYANRRIPFDMAASSGAKQLLRLYARIFYSDSVKKDISLIAMDEFDAFYHYEMSERLVRYLKSKFPQCQVLLTSHNTNLISNRILRPDCYFILSSDGRLTPLSEATGRDLREGHNLEKMYISGEFEEYE